MDSLAPASPSPMLALCVASPRCRPRAKNSLYRCHACCNYSSFFNSFSMRRRHSSECPWRAPGEPCAAPGATCLEAILLKVRALDVPQTAASLSFPKRSSDIFSPNWRSMLGSAHPLPRLPRLPPTSSFLTHSTPRPHHHCPTHCTHHNIHPIPPEPNTSCSPKHMPTAPCPCEAAERSEPAPKHRTPIDQHCRIVG